MKKKVPASVVRERHERRLAYRRRWRAARKALAIVAKTQEQRDAELAARKALAAQLKALLGSGTSSVRKAAVVLGLSVSATQRLKKHFS